MPDLEAVLQQLADLKTSQRAVDWSIADTVASIVPDGRPGQRNPAAGKCAEVLGCTSVWVKRLARVSRAFSPEHRYPDVPFGLYVVAIRADDPVYTLGIAIQDGLSVADLELKLRRGAAAVKERCPTCGKVKTGPAAASPAA
jgi:hypothetical protein